MRLDTCRVNVTSFFLLNLSQSLYVVEGFALVAPESGSYSVSLLLGVSVVRFVRNESSSYSVSLRLLELGYWPNSVLRSLKGSHVSLNQ